MLGNYTHTIDAKGRLFIPSKIREELGEVFYLALSDEKCLNGYSEENWEKFKVWIASLERHEQRKYRAIFSHGCKCELDSQGRVLLPKDLRDTAGLVKNVTIVGDNEYAEFWDSDEWAKQDALDLARLGDIYKSGVI